MSDGGDAPDRKADVLAAAAAADARRAAEAAPGQRVVDHKQHVRARGKAGLGRVVRKDDRQVMHDPTTLFTGWTHARRKQRQKHSTVKGVSAQAKKTRTIAGRRMGIVGSGDKLAWALDIVLRTPNEKAACARMCKERTELEWGEARAYYVAAIRFNAALANKTKGRSLDALRSEYEQRLLTAADHAAEANQWNAAVNGVRHAADVAGAMPRVVGSSVNVTNVVATAAPVDAREHAERWLAARSQLRQDGRLPPERRDDNVLDVIAAPEVTDGRGEGRSETAAVVVGRDQGRVGLLPNRPGEPDAGGDPAEGDGERSE